jgi:hypothetical protein
MSRVMMVDRTQLAAVTGGAVSVSTKLSVIVPAIWGAYIFRGPICNATAGGQRSLLGRLICPERRQ